MGETKSWSFLGHFHSEGRNSTFGLAYAVIIAAATFQSHAQRYKIGMGLLVLVAGVFVAKKAWDSHSILGMATALYSVVWLAPIIRSSIFYSVDGWFMVTHSILALAVAVGAFSYLKN
jgi:hypothetical protein